MEKRTNSVSCLSPMRRMFSLVIAAMLGVMSAWAQQTVTGTVVDTNDDPLAGVSVLVKGTQTGVSTDLDGNYSIAAKPNDVIIFRYIGMQTEEVKVGREKVINVVMKEDAGALDEVVVVGYGTQKRGSITGAVSTVSSKEILSAPTMSVSNMIGSRVAGIAAVQSSGQPGYDEAALTMRGQSGIVYVIDGIRRTGADFNNIDPNEIESISVLKDASAVAVYGLDANGVFIVTTKRGNTEKTTINYTGTVGWSQNAEDQVWLDGPGYAYWYNKAQTLNGGKAIFTQQMVESMVNGTNGWGNTNWYKEVFGTGFRTNHNLSASGGNEKYKFFVSVGYMKEDGNVKNFDFKRYNIRANIDANIVKGLNLTVGVAGRLENRNSPYFSANPNSYLNIGQQVARALPFAPISMDVNGETMWIATKSASSYSNPISSIEDSGYLRYNNNYFQSNLTLQYDFPFLKGLSFKFTGAYDTSFQFSKQLYTPLKYMLANDLSTLTGEELTYRGPVGMYGTGDDITLTEGASRSYTTTSQTSVNYNNSFGVHNVGALFLAETRQTGGNNLSATGYGLNFVSLDELNKVTGLDSKGEPKYPKVGGASSMTRSVGFVGRVNYNYDDRYFFEGTMRYDGSYLFGGMNKRWVALPGVSVGWRIDKEKFFKATWVNNLKLRAGYGKTATSGISAFQWRNNMAITNNAVMIGGGSQSMIYAATLGNPYLTWAKCNNYNVGVDAMFWNGLLGIEFDTFYKHEYDKLSGVTGAYPPSMGGYYFTTGNVNEADYKGFDMTITHTNHIGKFNYGAKLIWSYAYARWLKYSGDSENAPEYQRLTGKQVGSKYGFIATGLYQSQQDIDNAPLPPQAVQVGYIQYVDRNGDGKVDYDGDMGYVGKSATPTHTGSLNLFGNWNGFDFDMLWAWGLGHDVAMTGVYTADGSAGIMDHTAYTRPFYHSGNSPLYLVENAWTPDHTDALFPRLELNPISGNNAYASTWWYKKGDYLRLKTVQIGYTFPQKWMRHAGISKLRLYVEGYNLVTFSGLKKFNIDPEAPAVNNGYYPQQRKYAIGVNLSF